MILLPFKLARTFLRIAGIRGVFFMAVGVGIGMLIAPTSGARLRAKLKTKLEAASPNAQTGSSASTSGPTASPVSASASSSAPATAARATTGSAGR